MNAENTDTPAAALPAASPDTSAVNADTTATPAPEPGLPANPLLDVQFKPFGHYQEWLEQITTALRAGQYQVVLSLLYYGLDTPMDWRGFGQPEYTYCGRIITYLSLANGWTDKDSLKSPSDPRPRHIFDPDQTFCIGYDRKGQKIFKSQPELRGMIARQAIILLSPHYFKCGADFKRYELERNNGETGPAWFNEYVLKPDMLAALMAFFAPVMPDPKYTSEPSRISNLRLKDDAKPWEQTLSDFLANMCLYLWFNLSDSYVRQRLPEEQKSPALIRWTVEILAHIDRLDILERHLLTLDKTTLDTLHSIALRTTLRSSLHRAFEKDRRAETFEEAAFAGSKAALQ